MRGLDTNEEEEQLPPCDLIFFLAFPIPFSLYR